MGSLSLLVVVIVVVVVMVRGGRVEAGLWGVLRLREV